MKNQILFVDDEKNFLEGVRLMLRGQKDEWELTFATSVDEALERVEAIDFDAIISDVSMPVKTGLDLLEALNENGVSEHTPVIILTGNAESDLKRRALDLGATDLLNKPVVAEDLQARIRSVLRLRMYQEELRNHNEILERKVAQRTADLEHSRRDIIWRLARAGELRDEETGDHVVRVACCSRLLAEMHGLDEERVEIIFLTSALHDIGKIGVPDGILLKRGKLDASERHIMERHCEIGASILLEEPKGMRAFKDSDVAPSEGTAMAVAPEALRETAATIVISHHEKWNGNGYPHRLKGEDIPIEGRIVAISDVFDALRAERPYKDAFSFDRTMSIMCEGRGSHFDPTLFEVFESIAEKFEEIRERYSN